MTPTGRVDCSVRHSHCVILGSFLVRIQSLLENMGYVTGCAHRPLWNIVQFIEIGMTYSLTRQLLLLWQVATPFL